MVTLGSSPGSSPVCPRWRVTAVALAVIGGVVLGAAMADASAAILRSVLLCGGVVVIGLRAFRGDRWTELVHPTPHDRAYHTPSLPRSSREASETRLFLLAETGKSLG